ncbi:PVC-type heme-binding CxxCH protein [Rubripirellula reticaptiva]|uniref:Cytochrome c n=1 Tax=Rubripirellula reticaptiva TaxID=2528013 RepID=A0A5C6FE18_9BACT|nr:PVC-type heme-binding CxxCH protein [Rubripirellula reticaptiva]TWU57811.1 Cytochrome c [Rubripirellula reticaptiva]
MNTPVALLRALVILFVAGHTIAAADFPELFNSEPISDETLMPADEAAANFQLPEGFRASVFASEPDVQNPIAMTWDSKGRLWVAENYTYAERTQRFQLDLRDRVVIFDGTDGDHFKKRTVFTDNVQMLTGIEVGHDGVWLMCPPKLIFIPDRNHDDIPDNDGEVILDGFTVAQANYHNFANGLQFGPDGWLYGRCGGSCPGRIGKPGAPDHTRLALEGGIWRYHPITGQTEVLTTGTTNPWGHDWNNVGEMFFVNTVNGHLWHMIPGAHFTRPFTLDPNPRTYELIDFHADHWHFDTKGAWNESRDGVANAFGGGHAHCGTMIYQGGRWPESYNGKLFTLNFHGRRANQEFLEPKGSGYIARHGDDFMLSADPWFRGMELSSGPDGNVFVLDWADAGECHEHTGVHRTSGRVFKISSDSQHDTSETAHTDLQTWTTQQLVATHDQPNDWLVRQARLELARRHAKEVDMSDAVAILKQSIADPTDETILVQSLLTLHSIGGTDHQYLVAALDHANPHVRSWIIRMLTETWPIDDALGLAWMEPTIAKSVNDQANDLITKLCELASTEPAASVHLTLASTIQRLPVALRPSLAKALVGHVANADDHNLPLMIWYGLIPVSMEDPTQLVDVAMACQLPTTLRLISRSLAEQITEHPEAINNLLAATAKQSDDSFTTTVLMGISEGLKGLASAPQPESWNQLTSLDSPAIKSYVRELSVVFGDGRAIDELKKIVSGKVQADDEIRLSALASLIQNNPDDLRQICESLLQNPKMNVLAAQGLSRFDDPEIGKALVKSYNRFRAPQRPKIMSILASRPSFATAMLAAIEKGSINRQDLSAFQVRQIHSMNDADLTKTVGEVWGEVRDTPDAKQATIDSLKKSLVPKQLAEGDKSQGRALFAKACQTCHRLYGEGAQVGPDLTGANRANLDYLLTNIIDPSAVVDKDFRMTILLLEDDRIVNGLVTSENERTLSMQTATESFTIDKATIASRKITEKSPMPDGLFDTLSADQIRDLVAYLSHPSQVPMPTGDAKP